MSEIEKMYENAGIRYINLNACKINETDKDGKCEIIFYPEFTAEKQIEMIKYIALNDNIDYVKYYYQAIKGVWVFVCVTVTELASEMPKVYGAYHEEFEQALAGLINTLWQDLTDTKKVQIKEILK